MIGCPRFKIPDSRFQIQDSRFKIQDSRFQIQDSRFKIRNSAFTLIEVVLVLALMMFLAMASIGAIIGSTAQFAFQNTNEQVLDLINQARSLAISGKAQLNYTDYDGSGCTDDPPPQSPTDPCWIQNPATGQGYVTPAHYGFSFHVSTSSTDPSTVTLFADNHQPAANPTFFEGKFVPASSQNPVPDYRLGADIVLGTFSLPTGTALSIIDDSGKSYKDAAGNSYPSSSGNLAVFYTPVFADISFDPALPSSQKSLLRFKISQQNVQGSSRQKCYALHTISGIVEPYSCP